jgi:hypothetical protein
MLVRPNNPWLPGVLLMIGGAAGSWAVIVLLNSLLAHGVGLVWLASTVILGGVAVRLRQGGGSSCALGPRLQPLQVSCLGLLGLGVQLYQLADAPIFLARYPLLAAHWLPTASIVGGVLGLGILSTFADCRDAELRDRV